MFFPLIIFNQMLHFLLELITSKDHWVIALKKLLRVVVKSSVFCNIDFYLFLQFALHLAHWFFLKIDPKTQIYYQFTVLWKLFLKNMNFPYSIHDNWLHILSFRSYLNFYFNNFFTLQTISHFSHYLKLKSVTIQF